jgi:hypothetical protein
LTPAEKAESIKLEHLEKKCPYCRGIVLEVAVKCRHCGRYIYDSNIQVAPFDQPRNATMENYMSRALSYVFQLLGLLWILFGFMSLNTVYFALLLFPFGIGFWMVGAMGARWKKCSNCGCTIANKELSKCPRCYFEFMHKN